MTYKLSQLAPGTYDVLLNELMIASLVRSGPVDAAACITELLVDLPRGERPATFTKSKDIFGSLEEAQTWLEAAELYGPHDS
jgi:hypothetical protein